LIGPSPRFTADYVSVEVKVAVAASGKKRSLTLVEAKAQSGSKRVTKRALSMSVGSQLFLLVRFLQSTQAFFQIANSEGFKSEVPIYAITPPTLADSKQFSALISCPSWTSRSTEIRQAMTEEDFVTVNFGTLLHAVVH
jgi:hypothetical protein